MMRFYNQQHRFYCGVDLHARTLSLHVLDAQGQTALAKTLPADPDDFLQAIAPYRDGLVGSQLYQRAEALAAGFLKSR
jgi:hypothetical protein